MSRTRNDWLKVLGSLLITFLMITQHAMADTLPETYADVHKSLVLIFNVGAKDSGTGFIVKSTSTDSTILTAAHVIGKSKSVLVFLNDDLSTQYKASVAHIDTTLDLAALTIHKGNLPVLDVATETSEGAAIAVAGYPRASLDLLQATDELKPSVHEGVVSAVRLEGEIIEHSAVTDFGSSGGPVFDSQSGYVIGVVRGMLKNASGAYIATGYNAIHAFLKASGIGTAEDYATSATLPNVPGAYHLIYAQIPNTMNDQQIAIQNQIDYAVQTKLASLFTSSITTDKVTGFDTESIRQLCQKDNAIGVVDVVDSWDSKIGFFNNTISVKLDIYVLDCYGYTFFYSSKQKDAKPANVNYTVSADQIVSSFMDLLDQASGDIQNQITQFSTATTNFERYGVPIPTGQKRSLFALQAGSTGATVSAVAPYGTAARAGLQKGDVVTSINGTSVVNMSQDALNSLIAGSQREDWSFVVLSADGTQATVKFRNEDIRWYLSHPLPSP